MSDEIKIHGLDELDKAFKELELATSQKVLRSSLMWASKPMFEAMRDSAPEGRAQDYLKRKEKRKITTSLKQQTKRWSEKANDNASATVNLGYRSGGWYAFFLELGTQKIEPIGWMRRAAEQHWQEVALRFKKRIQWNLEKLEKTGKK